MTARPMTVRRRRERLSDTTILMMVAIAFFAAMYLFAYNNLGVGFTRPARVFDILNDNAYLIIIACGLSLVMITGSIDISVGGIVGFVTMFGAAFLRGDILPTPDMDPNLRIAIAVGISVAIGLAFGAFQGALIAYLDIQPFIVTLAGMFFSRGLITMTSGANISLSGTEQGKLSQAILEKRIEIPALGYEEFKPLKRQMVQVPAYVEYVIFVAIAVVIIIAVVLRMTKLGRHFYAVGGNRQSALMLGINVRRTRFLAHLISGLLAGIAGFVYLWHIKAGNIEGAKAAEMQSIASSIIGGTLLTGGVGNVIGTVFGVLILAMIKPMVDDAAVIDGFKWLSKSYWQQIFNGGVLSFFILMQSVLLKVRSNIAAKKNASSAPKEEPTALGAEGK